MGNALERRGTPAACILLLALCLLSCRQAAWLSDGDEATAEALRTGRTVILHICGSGREAADPALRAALDSPAAIRTLSRSHVLLRHDLSAEGLPEAEKERILRAYSPDAGDALYLLSAEGYVLCPIAPAAPDAESLRAAAVQAEQDGKTARLRELMACAQEADGAERVRAIDALYEATDARWRRALEPLYRTVPALDARNASGLVGKYELILAAQAAEPFLRAGDAAQAAKAFTDICEGGHLDDGERFLAYYQAAYAHALIGTDYDAILLLLEKAYESDPGAAAAPEVEATMQAVGAMQRRAAREER